MSSENELGTGFVLSEVMTDLLDTPAGDFEWGPRRRLDALRERVSKTTLSSRVPEIAMAVGAMILIGGAILLWLSFASSDAVAAPQEPPRAAVVQPAAAPFPTAEPEPLVIVHVSGLVADPGIVEIPTSARVFQAVEAAGGSLENADLDSINLAAPVIDGSQIHVPAQPAVEVSSTPDTALDVPLEPDASVVPTPVDSEVGSETGNAASTPRSTGQQTASISPSPDADSRATNTDQTVGQTPDQPSAESPADPWGAEEPNPIPPEVEELMAERETAPTADEVEALLVEAGLGEPAS